MPGNDCFHIHFQDAIERGYPAVEVAITKPRKAPVEEQITHEDDACFFEINYKIAVGMRGSPIFEAQRIRRQIEFESICKSLRRAEDGQRLRSADTVDEPLPLPLRY